MNSLLLYAKVFFILILSFFAFSVLTCLIPYTWIKKNMEKSIIELLDNRNDQRAILKGDPFRQDYFTDAIILNIMASSNSKQPVRSALMNPYTLQNPEAGYSAIAHLDYKVKYIEISPNITYSRYWFGSAALGKVLMLAMNYQQIRWFLYLVSTILLIIFAVTMVNKIGWMWSFPFFLSLIFVNFFVTQFMIQYFPTMALALIGGIWICRNELMQRKQIALFLFICGIFTAYFDLLTIPFITLLFPLMVYLILKKKENKRIWELFKSIFILSILWFIGFACAWIIKWVLVVIFADPSGINSAVGTILFRISTREFSRWDAVVRNFQLIPLIWLVIVLIFLLLLTFISFNKKGTSLALAFLFVGLLPYLWYGVLANHTYLHYWFTYRGQLISMGCAMLVFVSLIDWERLKLKLKICN